MVVLLCGGIILSLNMGLRSAHGLFVEPITGDLGLSHGTVAFAFALQNLIWGLLTPFAGMAADRFGTARVLALGGVLYAAGTALMALGGSATTLTLGGGVLIGMAIGACGFPLVLSAVARAVPAKSRSMALGVVSAGGSIGQMAFPPLAQWVIGGSGWVTSLLMLAVFAALVVPLAAAFAGPAAAAADDGPEQSLKAALHEAAAHRGFWLLSAGFFVCGFHIAFITVHLPGYLVSCNLAPIVGATALALIGFFNTIGTWIVGALGDRYRKKYLLSCIYVARAVVMTVFLAFPVTETSVLVFSAVFGMLWLSTVPLTGALVAHIFGPRYMATLFGIVMLSHQLGSFVGAWMGGLSVDLTGSYDMVWMVAVVLGLLSAALHMPIADTPLVRRPAAA